MSTHTSPLKHSETVVGTSNSYNYFVHPGGKNESLPYLKLLIKVSFRYLYFS